MFEQNFICPQCHSDNIQKFEIVYNNGVSNSSSSTIGVGYAGSFGVGTATTTGVSVSNLSQSVAPPSKKGYFGTFIKGIVLIAVIQLILGAAINSSFAAIMSWICFAGLIYWMYKNVYLWNRDVFPKLISEWHNSYLCLKCGNRFIL